MNYRMAEPVDFPAIMEYLDSTKYFNPVNPFDVGGHWIIAELDGEVRGTVWCFAEPPNCFVDYWSASGPVVATKMLWCLNQFCVTNKVTRVHGIIASDNLPALNMATNGYDALAAAPYHRIYKELVNGAENNRTEDHNTVGGRSGASTT